MWVVTLSHRRRSLVTEGPGKGCFNRGQAGSSQERKNEAFGRRAEFLWQQRLSTQLHLSWGKGPMPGGEGGHSPPSILLWDCWERAASSPWWGAQHRALLSHRLSPSAGSSHGLQHAREKLSKTPMETFGRAENRVWKTNADQPHYSSRNILSISVVAFQSLSIFSINKYFKPLCFKIYCIIQVLCNASHFRSAGCQAKLLLIFKTLLCCLGYHF